MVRETIDYRLKNNIEREGEEQLTTDEIAAQCFVCFLGGFGTSSTTTTFALYHLVKYPDIQEKLRDEIKSVLAKYDN